MRTALALVLVALLAAAEALAFSGTVEKVHDGDTVTVEGVRVRLFGIDAPELSQPGGRQSRDYLASLALGRVVRIERRDTDAYGRLVGVVVLPGGDEAGAMMVKAGHAWVYTLYCDRCYGLKLAQAAARMRGLGLWAAPRPVPPWKWRKTHGRTR